MRAQEGREDVRSMKVTMRCIVLLTDCATLLSRFRSSHLHIVL